MFRKLSINLDDMALALVLWLCTLPLVGLLVIPFFGLKVGLVVAAVSFLITLTICWGVCGWKLSRD
jgi:hypothetical protein